MKFIKSVSFYMRPYLKRYIIGVLWLIAIDTTVILMPQIIRSFANDYQMGMLTREKLITYALLTIGGSFFMAVGRYFWRVMLFGNCRRIEYDIRKQLFQHWLSMDREFYNYNKVGDLMAYATNDINAIKSFTGEGIMMSVDSSFMLLLTIFMMIKTSGLKITMITLIPVPISALLIISSGKFVHRIFRARQDAYANLSDVTTESFSGMSVIKAFVEEEHAKDRFREANEHYFKKNLDVVKYTTFLFPLMVVMSGFSYMLVIYVGSRFVINGTMTLGDFIAHYSYVGIIMWPARSLGIIITMIQQGNVSMGRIKSMLANKPRIKEPEEPLGLPMDKASIEFKNVSFKYPGEKKYALENISFKLKDGESLAIVGKTGSSKSTILKLVFREYLPTSGDILIDGIPIDRISMDDLTEKSGYVPQDSFLFSETLHENIAFSFDNPVERELVHKAANMSDVYDDIINFQKGFDTVIGERGVTLSGGQKQRVAIARALIKEPKLLVMDDSLSAVDTDTEKKILSHLKKFKATTLIVAHRISSIKNSDEIVFLEDGKIIERGSHDELIKMDGEYNKMYQNQLLESLGEDEDEE